MNYKKILLSLGVGLSILVFFQSKVSADNDISSGNVVVNPKFLDGHNNWSWSSWGDQTVAPVEESWGEIWNGTDGNILADHGRIDPPGQWSGKLPDPFAGLKKWVTGDSVYQDIDFPSSKQLNDYIFSAGTFNSAQKVKDQDGNTVLYADGSGIKVTFYDETGSIISTNETGPSSQYTMTTLSLNGKIPKGTKKARIELLGYAAYPQWIDAYWANVNFTYQYNDIIPAKDSIVTAKYVDDKGKEIADKVVLSGNVGESYSTTQKSIAGYTFKAIQGNTSGTFTDKEQKVTYVYTKDPVAGGKVTANYVDDKGQKIAEQAVLNGNVGEIYSTTQKKIAGYAFKTIQGNASGTFTDKEQTVTYVYTKNTVPSNNPEQPVKPDNHKGNTNNPITNNADSKQHVVKKVVDAVLPKTAAEKIGFSAIVAAIILVITGGLIVKIRRNKQ